VLGRRTILEGSTVDVGKLIILIIAVAALWRFKRLPEPLVVAAAALVGLLVYQRF
jgi:chromate transporter